MPNVEVTPAELQWLEAKRRERVRVEAFARGLQRAAVIAENWAEEAAGGSGKGGDGYRNLANAFRREAEDAMRAVAL